MGRMGKPLSFKGSAFHRVIPDFMCQGERLHAVDTTTAMRLYGSLQYSIWLPSCVIQHTGMTSLQRIAPV